MIVLLRGINLGSRNRISMGPLRGALSAEGFGNVRTYLQSGNILLDTSLTAEEVRTRVTGLLVDRFDLPVPAVVRTRDELAAVVARNPLKEVATEPKHHQVVFLSAEPEPAAVERVARLACDGEAFAAVGRELYGWHPANLARSKLAMAMADRRLGVTATARNWATVSTLLALADAG